MRFGLFDTSRDSVAPEGIDMLPLSHVMYGVRFMSTATRPVNSSSEPSTTALEESSDERIDFAAIDLALVINGHRFHLY